MLIDISSISDRKSTGKIDILEKKTVIINDYEAPVTLAGTVVKKGGLYRLDGVIEGEVLTYCSKCLKEVILPYRNQITQLFRRVSEQAQALNDDTLVSEDELLVFDGHKVDFEPIVAGLIQGDMPIAVKCSESCKGLCPVCGSDLNVSQCNCDNSYVNPAFEKLKGLVFETE